MCLCWLSKAPTFGWFEKAPMTPPLSHWRHLSCSWKDGLDKRKYDCACAGCQEALVLSHLTPLSEPSGQTKMQQRSHQHITIIISECNIHVLPMGNCQTQKRYRLNYIVLCSAHVSCPEMGGREGGQRSSATFSRWYWISLVRTNLECKSTATLTYCYTFYTI